MGAEKHFRPGSFYRICDQTGFATRAENTRMEWNGLIVRGEVFEARQPQDYVTGIPDNQTVPKPRSRQANTFVGNSTTAEFQVYGDLPGRVTFEIQNGSIMVTKGFAVVTSGSI